MLFKGTLSRCIDFLARKSADTWTNRFIVIHVPAWHCYCVCGEGNPYQHISVPDQLHSRVIFDGSIVELAHFVLCPPLTNHLTRHTLPDLPENEAHADHPDAPAQPVPAGPGNGTRPHTNDDNRDEGGHGVNSA